MVLNPQNIHDKKFSIKMRGYNIDEVNDFLDRVTKDYQITIAENQNLKKELSQSKGELAQYDNLKTSLNQSLIVAQETADNVVEHARIKSNEIIDRALARVKKLGKETSFLRDNVVQFREKLKGMLQYQVSITNDPKWDQLLAQTKYENDTQLKKLIDELDNHKKENTTLNARNEKLVSNDEDTSDKNSTQVNSNEKIDNNTGISSNENVYPNDNLH